jgi:WD40 repeat protein
MPELAPAKPTMLFYVYAHEDEALRQQLEKHLKLLQRQKLLSTWYDRAILPGKDWGREIDDHLNRADLILLLISASFLASDYCYDIEMQRALERYQRGEARVIPVILRPCDWEKAPFGALPALPLHGKAITSWQNQDEAFAEVARHLRSLLEQQDLFSPLKKPVLQCPLTGNKGWVHAVAISADGRIIVSGGFDGAVKVWRLPEESDT